MKEIELTRSWLQKVVIDLGLCPFAYEVFSKDKIQYELIDFSKAEELVELFTRCINHILDASSSESTSLIIISSGLERFDDYLVVYESLAELLSSLTQGDKIQLASFHPYYQFAGTNPDDVENYTNRSPYPIIHLLKVEDVSEAIDSHPDITSVPAQNISTMTNIGINGIKKLLDTL